MARRRNRRYRQGRFLPLLRVLFFLLFCAALAGALTIFFKVEEVTVSGNSRYTVQEIVEATGVEAGDNLFLLNKFDISDRLTHQLPYIGDVQIRRRLPSTLTIEVKEIQAAAAVEVETGWWYISADGKLLELNGDSGSLQQVTGVMPLLPTAGGDLALPEEGNISAQRLLELLQALSDKGMERLVSRVDCSNKNILVLRYSDRFRVELRYDANFSRRLEQLVEVVARLEENETGTIRMTESEDTAYVIRGTPNF